jgi:hypothetical protein
MTACRRWISAIRTIHASANDIGVSRYFCNNLRNASTCSSITVRNPESTVLQEIEQRVVR